ncbi:MAG: hypothetical protein WKF96_20260 [Solirubrobacteraceae bacterium]
MIGPTIINACWLLDRDGTITITIPERIRVSADVIAPTLMFAASGDYHHAGVAGLSPVTVSSEPDAHEISTTRSTSSRPNGLTTEARPSWVFSAHDGSWVFSAHDE